MTRVLPWMGFDQHQEHIFGFRNADMIPVILSLVDDPQPRVREMVAYQLSPPFATDQCMPALLHMLDDPEATVRAAAACSLGAFRREAVAALPRLLELLDDPDANCRVNAGMAIWQLDPQQHAKIMPVLCQALTTAPNYQTRIRAIHCLLQVNKDRTDAFPFLVESALRDANVGVRGTAASALPVFGRPAIPILTVVLRDAHPSIRGAAADALGIIGPDAREALPALQALAADPNPYVRVPVLNALRRIDPEQFPAPKDEPE